MKKLLSLLLVAAIFLAGCATMVRIETDVPGANVKINGQSVGTTPVVRNLSDAIWENFNVEIAKDGYKTFHGTLAKEFKVGALIGGLIMWPLLLWTYGPQPYQNFELEKQ